MTKHKPRSKDKKKGSQLVIRVDKAERDAFVALCDRLDTSAAREIRRFMRELVAAHSDETPAPMAETETGAVTATDPGPGDEGAPAQAETAVEVPAQEPGKPRKSRAARKKA